VLAATAGEQHAIIERKGVFWHIYVGDARRATVLRENDLITFTGKEVMFQQCTIRVRQK
jgi:Zn/Cd-binding protein ZinT